MRKLSKQAQQVLVAAAEMISEHPEAWMKGDYRAEVDGEQRFCAIGAVQLAAEQVAGTTRMDDLVEEICAVTNRLIYHLPADHPHGVYEKFGEALVLHDGVTVEGFNDARETTYDDVKALFCRAVRAEVDDDSSTTPTTTEQEKV